jgi:hypothetical protein
VVNQKETSSFGVKLIAVNVTTVVAPTNPGSAVPSTEPDVSQLCAYAGTLGLASKKPTQIANPASINNANRNDLIMLPSQYPSQSDVSRTC